MVVKLDIFEMYYLLESCFRGSHLRSDTIIRFVDEWYEMLEPSRRSDLYNWILRDIYNNKFEKSSKLCGADLIFMARYNPDNQYIVTLSNGEVVNTFLLDDKYYVLSNKYCDPSSIIKVEKVENSLTH